MVKCALIAQIMNTELSSAGANNNYNVWYTNGCVTKSSIKGIFSLLYACIHYLYWSKLCEYRRVTVVLLPIMTACLQSP